MPTFSNQATLSYNGLTTTSNVVTGELVDVLSASKETLNNTYTAGQNLPYIITLVNTGNTDLTGLTVTDNLGSFPFGAQTLVPLTYVPNSVRYYVNGVLQPAPVPTSVSPLTVSGIRVPAGGNTVIAYEAEVNSFAPQGTGETILNTATVTGAGVNTPVTASTTAVSADTPVLTINKGVSPATVTENGQLTYTFTIENSGSTEAGAGANVVISDTFNPILNPITVTLDGVPLTAGTDYTYDTATGAFATTAGRVTVPVAAYSRNAVTGTLDTAPGSTVLVVSGTV